MTVRIESACASCGAELALDLTDQLEWKVLRGPDLLLVFEPEIDWSRFKAPTILNDY
ncbi:MAG TPA: hypothetical protein VEK56_14575 [Vicinamibacterales bacterium]|nr:hypothetical protein [Vicinamibacterales bacterium]